jgi:hypothetical protein
MDELRVALGRLEKEESYDHIAVVLGCTKQNIRLIAQRIRNRMVDYFRNIADIKKHRETIEQAFALAFQGQRFDKRIRSRFRQAGLNSDVLTNNISLVQLDYHKNALAFLLNDNDEFQRICKEAFLEPKEIRALARDMSQVLPKHQGSIRGVSQSDLPVAA